MLQFTGAASRCGPLWCCRAQRLTVVQRNLATAAAAPDRSSSSQGTPPSCGGQPAASSIVALHIDYCHGSHSYGAGPAPLQGTGPWIIESYTQDGFGICGSQAPKQLQIDGAAAGICILGLLFNVDAAPKSAPRSERAKAHHQLHKLAKVAGQQAIDVQRWTVGAACKKTSMSGRRKCRLCSCKLIASI